MMMKGCMGMGCEELETCLHSCCSTEAHIFDALWRCRPRTVCDRVVCKELERHEEGQCSTPKDGILREKCRGILAVAAAVDDELGLTGSGRVVLVPSPCGEVS